MYQKGEFGVRIDPVKAYQCYTRAAKLGHKDAQFKQAQMIQNGEYETGQNQEEKLKLII